MKEAEAPGACETNYRLLFEHMMDGVAYCKMLFDEKGEPQDFIYLEVNAAFEKLTGLEGVTGKRVLEVIPNIKEEHPELIELYKKVSLTGKPEKVEMLFKPLSMWLDLSIYSPQKEYFVVVFDDITERKKNEMELKTKARELETLNRITMDRESKMVELKKKIKDLEKELQEK